MSSYYITYTYYNVFIFYCFELLHNGILKIDLLVKNMESIRNHFFKLWFGRWSNWLLPNVAERWQFFINIVVKFSGFNSLRDSCTLFETWAKSYDNLNLSVVIFQMMCVHKLSKTKITNMYKMRLYSNSTMFVLIL